jgi:hypothetical protein
LAEVSFAAPVTAFWREQFAGEVVFRDEAFVWSVNPGLAGERLAMLLDEVGGPVSAVLSPAVAGAVDAESIRSADELRVALRSAGIVLHGADLVFYFTDAERDAVFREQAADGVRRLTADDEAAFAEFESAASAQDLDDAYVELDHWAVFGAFVNGRLACAASAYPWRGGRFADMGVLTLAPHRGQGHARRVVRAISRHIVGAGYEPQYRCQLDNLASIAVARAAGLTEFGTWEASG